MNISCDIIRDLLPLYVDDVCSVDSRDMVETHLQDCPDCSEELKMMQSGVFAQVIAEEVDSAQAAKRAWKKVKIKNIMIGLLIAAVLGSIVYGLTEPNVVAVSEEYLEIGEVCRMESGAIYLEVTVTDGMKHNFIRYRTVGEAYYISPMQPLITTKEDPDFVDRKNTTCHLVGVSDDCKAIYVGWGDDAILIWEEGMALPDASAEIEEEWAFLSHS